MSSLPCNIDEVKKNGVYFLSYSNWLSHICLCLADGLNQLGIPVFSNIEADVRQGLKIGNFQKVNWRETAFLIIDIQQDSIEYPQQKVVESPHPRTLAFSMSDTIPILYLTDKTLLFCTHENKYYRLFGNRVPWAFGLSSHMIYEAHRNRTDKRHNVILRNFRTARNQNVRDSLDLILLPHLTKYFEIDRRIQNNHFEKLSSYIGCLAYGGSFIPKITRDELYYPNQPWSKFLENVKFLQEPVILRWDSWRFWESLTCGCLTFHLDFDKYGFMLPVMPENWKHYIGLNLEDVKGDIERLIDERDKIPEIAENGRLWALAHYSPLATAKRFLGYVTYQN